ncbi:MAG: restriction endonuclease subunit S [Clostridiales bacterium]|nr:restriction endonuclease subunit S [Clostridiales bacterium]MCF8023080.1 restriction endonuclease subunit S [Clostridiales bacterium]
MGIMDEKYKDTELGKIPVDWEVDYIDKVAKRFSGHTPDKKKTAYWDGNIPWISLKDLHRLDKRYINETEDYTTQEGINNSSAVILPQETVVLSRDATIGKVGITGREMATSQHFINYVCNDNLYNMYLYCDFYYRKPMFERLSIGSTIKTLGLGFFDSLKIVLPPLPEQKKIADILSTVDQQIEQTDALIEKTKELKKGLMQKLLTKGIGHTELKKTEVGEIPVEWEVKIIKEVCATTSGSTPSRRRKDYYKNGIYPWIKTGELYAKYIYDTEEKINDKALNETSVELLPEDSVIMAMYGATIGQLSIIKVKATTNQACCAIQAKSDDIEHEFIYYNLIFNRFRLIQMSAGGAQPNISQQIIKEFKIAIPPKSEQKKIADILSEIDQQQNYYESKKQYLQQLKKGLMQKLLTGKTRVKVSEEG